MADPPLPVGEDAREWVLGTEEGVQRPNIVAMGPPIGGELITVVPKSSLAAAERRAEAIKVIVESQIADERAEKYRQKARADSLEAERDQARKDATQMSCQVDEYATRIGRLQGEREAASWPGVIEGWKARVAELEAALRTIDFEAANGSEAKEIARLALKANGQAS